LIVFFFHLGRLGVPAFQVGQGGYISLIYIPVLSRLELSTGTSGTVLTKIPLVPLVPLGFLV